MERTSVLIIDDDTGLRKTLADILKVKGHDVLVAASGAEGLALWREHAASLVLIDLGLPDMSGLEVLEKIKADQPAVEVIILTGNATLDSAIEAANCGAFSYLVKPYEMDNLLLLARRAIEKQETETRLLRHNLMLKRTNAELRALYEVSQALSRTLELKKLTAEVLQALSKTDIFPFEIKGAIYLMEEDRVNLTSFIGMAEEELTTCKEILFGRCLCGQAVESGKIVVSTDSSEDLRHQICPAEPKPHGHLIVPLKAVGKSVGLLNLYLEPGTQIGEGLLKLFSTLGNQVGIAINNAKLYEDARTFSLQDPLTGLGNRRLLETRLDKTFQAAMRYGEGLSVIMVDIDHFKNYNDTLGHQAGDDLLVKLAQIFLREVRRADSVFRYGGEEFLILLPETDPPQAVEAAERLRKAVEKEAGVTVSLGVSALNGYVETPEKLIAEADNALYRAKQNGRNRVERNQP